MITDNDEELHPIKPAVHWQESFYFSWADPRHDVFGLTRIGLRLNEQRMDGMVLCMHRGALEYAYGALGVRHTGPWSDQGARAGVRTRSLGYRMLEPLSRWNLTLDGAREPLMQLEWTATSPPFDYHDSGQPMPTSARARHFEQAGRVTGMTRFHGRELRIAGSGHRDKSWGERDWASIEGWNWVSAQFGDELAFNAWEGWFGGTSYINGFVFQGGKNDPIRDLSIRFDWSKTAHVPARAHLDIITDSSSQRLRITATTMGQCALIKRGLLIQEAHSSFVAEVGSRTLHGIGVTEHAWRPGRLHILRRLPELAGMLRRLV